MTKLISSAEWASFRQAINDASDTFNNELIVWKHSIKKLDYNGDDRGGLVYDTRQVRCLIEYNAFRVWPVDKLTAAGLIDRDCLVVIVNKDYLGTQNFLNSDGNMDLDLAMDRFIIHGITYKIYGDTQISQADDDPLLFYYICVRDEYNTGNNKV